MPDTYRKLHKGATCVQELLRTYKELTHRELFNEREVIQLKAVASSRCGYERGKPYLVLANNRDTNGVEAVCLDKRGIYAWLNFKNPCLFTKVTETSSGLTLSDPKVQELLAFQANLEASVELIQEGDLVQIKERCTDYRYNVPLIVERVSAHSNSLLSKVLCGCVDGTQNSWQKYDRWHYVYEVCKIR